MTHNRKSYPTSEATEINGLWMQWSPVNQAWFIMWHHSVERIISDKNEACAEFDYLVGR